MKKKEGSLEVMSLKEKISQNNAEYKTLTNATREKVATIEKKNDSRFETIDSLVTDLYKGNEIQITTSA